MLRLTTVNQSAHGIGMITQAYDPMTLMDFTDPDTHAAWHPINDSVMGGQSRGGAQFVDHRLVFKGDISLANNGGFASIRARDQHHDLSAFDSVLLRVKGDGRTYQFRLYTDAHYQGSRIAFATRFQTIKDTWLELRLHFSQLQPTLRGRQLSGPAFDPRRIQQMGFLLADKQEGAFELLVDWIKAV